MALLVANQCFHGASAHPSRNAPRTRTNPSARKSAGGTPARRLGAAAATGRRPRRSTTRTAAPGVPVRWDPARAAGQHACTACVMQKHADAAHQLSLQHALTQLASCAVKSPYSQPQTQFLDLLGTSVGSLKACGVWEERACGFQEAAGACTCVLAAAGACMWVSEAADASEPAGVCNCTFRTCCTAATASCSGEAMATCTQVPARSSMGAPPGSSFRKRTPS